MKFPKKSTVKYVYGVAAFNGIVTQYFDTSFKEAEDTFYKSHTATHMYRMEGTKKAILKENNRRNNHGGAITAAFKRALDMVAASYKN